ncbi:hypothetical protein Rhal01_02294 [Rubritalea halochordaticola]|uniref:Uncharacterized protein n=1 Tax=Rubritalea halochordaticola TaxID=714537 RepID=A0ABP9V089_9BACT
MIKNEILDEAIRDYENVLHSIPLFSNVGDLIEDSERSVKNWYEVYTLISKQNKWLNFKNVITNVIADVGFEFDLDEAFHEIEKISGNFVDSFFKGFEEPEIFHSAAASGKLDYHVKWDLNFLGVERVLSTETNNYPKFFTDMIFPWYQKGHFPCGWNGKMIKQSWEGKALKDLPNGKVRVY